MTEDGEAAVHAAVESAAPITRRSTKDSQPGAEAIADSILEAEVLMADRHGLVYLHDGRCWERLTDFELQTLIWRAAGSAAEQPAKRAATAQLVALKTAAPDLSWGRVADHEIACFDGVLDLLTNEIRPHRPENFIEQTLAQDYDAGAVSPTWSACLEKWFGSADDDRAMALQEFAGYICMSHAKYKKALLLYGPGDTGKSVAVWVLQELVGPSATCSLSVEAMDDPVRLPVIRGKLLNVISELSGKALVRDSGFKTLISTEEPVFLNPKWEHPLMYLPRAKHVIATNELPHLAGRTVEIFNRLLIIKMDRIIEAVEQDRDLLKLLGAEMPGIFAWAIGGARVLLKRGGEFTIPIGREEVLTGWRRETNPVLDWLDDNLRRRPGSRLPFATVAVAASERMRRSVTAVEVGKAAKELGLSVKTARPTPGVNAVRCILDHEIDHPKQWTEDHPES